jgi:hypothetical protein
MSHVRVQAIKFGRQRSQCVVRYRSARPQKMVLSHEPEPMFSYITTAQRVPDTPVVTITSWTCLLDSYADTRLVPGGRRSFRWLEDRRPGDTPTHWSISGSSFSRPQPGGSGRTCDRL